MHACVCVCVCVCVCLYARARAHTHTHSLTHSLSLSHTHRLKMGLAVGEPKCLGTAAVALCMAARHEDVEEDVLQHGKWVPLLGAGSEDAEDAQEREAVPEAALRYANVHRALLPYE